MNINCFKKYPFKNTELGIRSSQLTKLLIFSCIMSCLAGCEHFLVKDIPADFYVPTPPYCSENEYCCQAMR